MAYKFIDWYISYHVETIDLTLLTPKGCRSISAKSFTIEYREIQPQTPFVDKEIKTYQIKEQFYLILN